VLYLHYLHGHEEGGRPQELEAAHLLRLASAREVEVKVGDSQIVSFSAEANFGADTRKPIKEDRPPARRHLTFLSRLEAVWIDLVVLLGLHETSPELIQLIAFVDVDFSRKNNFTKALSWLSGVGDCLNDTTFRLDKLFKIYSWILRL